MKIKIFVVFTLSLFIAEISLADLEVAENGNVGIGTSPKSYSRLSSKYSGTSTSAIGVHGEASYTNSNGYKYGTGGYFTGGQSGVEGYSYGNSQGTSYGTKGYSIGSKNNYGLYGYAYSYGGSSGSSTSYGVYGNGFGGKTNYAGYFSGNVHATGTVTWASDGDMKKEVKSLNNVLPKLMKLKAKSYFFKNENKKYKRMNLAEGNRFGLVAQDLEMIFPHMVSEEIFVDFNDPQSIENVTNQKEPEVVKYKSINYIELIPVLIQAIQEQQQQIEELKANAKKHKEHKVVTTKKEVTPGYAAILP